MSSLASIPTGHERFKDRGRTTIPQARTLLRGFLLAVPCGFCKLAARDPFDIMRTGERRYEVPFIVGLAVIALLINIRQYYLGNGNFIQTFGNPQSTSAGNGSSVRTKRVPLDLSQAPDGNGCYQWMETIRPGQELQIMIATGWTLNWDGTASSFTDILLQKLDGTVARAIAGANPAAKVCTFRIKSGIPHAVDINLSLLPPGFSGKAQTLVRAKSTSSLRRGAAKSIWTTSVYSYAPTGSSPGGGLENDELVVGGWRDLYYSLLEFDLSGLPHNAQYVHLDLFCFARRGGVATTGIYVDRITVPWDWRTQGTGTDRLRLWWADRPAAEPWTRQALSAPELGQWYSIDITTLYNAWQDGTYLNFGVQIRPEFNTNTFDEFYSSNYADDPSLKPRLVVEP